MSKHQTNKIDASFYWGLLEFKDYQGKGTMIAIIDSGIQEDHPSFRPTPATPKIIAHYLEEFDSAQDTDKTDFHGTACATIACGGKFEFQHGLLRGVAPRATLIALKAFNSSEFPLRNIKPALEFLQKYAKNLDVVVIPSGLKANKDNTEEKHEISKAIKALVDKRVIIVCAAGNDGNIDSQNVCFPANSPETICVGSCTEEGKPSKFSPEAKETDFLAFGEPYVPVKKGHSMFVKKIEGTSFAAPALGGLICLILEAVEDQLGKETHSKIHETAIMKEILKSLCSDDNYKSIKRDEVQNFLTNPNPFIEKITYSDKKYN